MLICIEQGGSVIPAIVDYTYDYDCNQKSNTNTNTISRMNMGGQNFPNGPIHMSVFLPNSCSSCTPLRQSDLNHLIPSNLDEIYGTAKRPRPRPNPKPIRRPSTYSSSEMTRLSTSSSSSTSSSPVLYAPPSSAINSQINGSPQQFLDPTNIEEDSGESGSGGEKKVAALVIQRAFRRYSMVKEFQRIKNQRRNSRRINSNVGPNATQTSNNINGCEICIDHGHVSSEGNEVLDEDLLDEDSSLPSSNGDHVPAPGCIDVNQVEVEISRHPHPHVHHPHLVHHQHLYNGRHNGRSGSSGSNSSSSLSNNIVRNGDFNHVSHTNGRHTCEISAPLSSRPYNIQQSPLAFNNNNNHIIQPLRQHNIPQGQNQRSMSHPHVNLSHQIHQQELLRQQQMMANGKGGHHYHHTNGTVIQNLVNNSSSVSLNSNSSSSLNSSGVMGGCTVDSPTNTKLLHPSMSQQLSDVESEIVRKRLYRVGLNLFNKKPETGINYLVKKRFLEGSPPSVARFLISRKGLSKQMIGEYLSNLQSPFSMACLEHFANEIDISSMPIDLALRRFQTFLRMPGEAQKIERVVESFSRRYAVCNPHSVAQFRNGTDDSSTVFVLSFAIIMLNTDLHTPHIKSDRRMKLEDFIKNLRGIDDGADVERETLIGIYERIKHTELKCGSDHVTQVMKVQQTIVGKKPNLAIPHRRLVCYCRLYEVSDINKKDKAGSHQREVFLFNDAVVLTKIFHKKRNSVTYSFRQCIPLVGISLHLFSNQYFEFGLTLKRGDSILIHLNARNEHDRAKFTEDLREAIAESDEMQRIETLSKENRDRDSGVEIGKIKRFSNSLLDINDQLGKPVRRGSCGSLDSGMSISFVSDEIQQLQLNALNHQNSHSSTGSSNSHSHISQQQIQQQQQPQLNHHLHMKQGSSCSSTSSSSSHNSHNNVKL